MWIEYPTENTIKIVERYECPKTGKERRVSKTVEKGKPALKKAAINYVLKEVERRLTPSNERKYKLEDLGIEFINYKSASIQPATQRNLHYTFNWIKWYLPRDVYIDQLDTVTVQKMLNSCLQKKSYTYASRVLSWIKQFYKYCYRMDYITNIAFIDRVELLKPPKTEEQLAKAGNKFLDADELKTVIEEMKKIDVYIALLIEFLSLTGLRIGELLGIRLKEIKSDYVEITGTYSHGKRGTPKNAYSYRNVYLNKRAIEIIDIFKQKATLYHSLNNVYNDDEQYVFITSKGKPYDPHFINRKLRRIKFPKHLTTHIFRHTHISMLTEKGMPLKMIMKRVGHNEPKTTLSVYSHVTAKMLEESNKILESL